MIIPSLDLINGKIVRLYKGNYKKQFNYSKNPILVLKEYQKLGSKMIHIIDLDGAKNPKEKQFYLIKRIIKSLSIPIQVGGGIRNRDDIDYFLNLGAKRIVIGSMVIKNPEKVKKWIKIYGCECIVIALDIIIDKNNNKKVMINGWQKNTNINLEDIIDDFCILGIRHVLCTDISCDGTLKGPNVNLYKEITDRYPKIHFQASGGIGTIKDIKNLKQSGVKGIIVGRSLIEDKINIKDAILC